MQEGTDEGRDLVKTLNTIDRITENNEYSWRQNAEAHLKSDFTLGGQVAKFFGANISGGTNIGAENASSQLDGQAFDINNERKHKYFVSFKLLFDMLLKCIFPSLVANRY